jgi:hypothetical protein
MNIGDIVVVVDSESLPDGYIGRYGVVTEISEYKVMVEFNKRINGRGSLSHTAYAKDLQKVGEASF